MDLMKIYDHLSDMIFLLDANDHIICLNQSAKKYFAAQDIIGQHYKIICQPSENIEWKIIGIEDSKIIIGILNQKHAADFYLESILMSSPSNIYWLDQEGRSIGCNDQQAKCVGLNSRHDIIGTTVFDLSERLGWPPGLAEEIRKKDLEVMRSKQCITYRENVILNGEEKVYLGVKSPMLDETGESIGILGISTDITPQVRVERELELAKQKAETAYRYKTEFISNITHDIRTPLVGIHGVATWLAEAVSADLVPEVNALIKSSNELLHLLNNVISLSKLELEDTQNKHVSFSLRQLITGLIDLLMVIAKQKKLSLTIDYPENLPENFLGNSYLVQQIILNLLSNALKFTEKGSVIVSISNAPNFSTENKQIFSLLITIEDTGIGIPKSYFEDIFENFGRLNKSYENAYYSSGLGLPIVRRSVTHLGGKVWVESEVGKGSRFFVFLPLLLTQSTITPVETINEWKNKMTLLQSQKPLKIHQSVLKNSTAFHILLVEDNILIQKGMIFLLNQLNCYVDIADTANRALELLESEDYHLIFMDIGLPDHDGFWATQQIRRSFIKYKHIPIIALTAHLDEEYRSICQKAGMNDIITKPLTFEEALNCLQTYNLSEKIPELV